MSSHKLAVLGTALALACAASSAQAALIDFSTLQTNGSATATSSVLRLTDGSNLADPDDIGTNIGEVGSAFIGTAFNSDLTFTSSFTFSMTNTGFSPLADGLTFLIQASPDGVSALGGGGGGVGANGITNSVGIGFQSWDNNRVSIFRNGNISGGPHHNYNLGDQDDLVDVTVAYDGTVLSYTAHNYATGLDISGSRTIRLSNLGSEVYFGFTGGTGLSYSIQDVTNWNLDVGAGIGAVPEPASWALMLVGFGGLGGMLRRRRAIPA